LKGGSSHWETKVGTQATTAGSEERLHWVIKRESLEEKVSEEDMK